MTSVSRMVIACALLVAGLLSSPPTSAATGAPPHGKLNAQLSPPYTYFSAEVTDPEGGPLTYDWSATSIQCGSWQPGDPSTFNSGAATAAWYHGGGVGSLNHQSGTECSHTGGTNSANHPGTFRVKVSDPEGNTVICENSGPETDSGPACTPLQYDLSMEIKAPEVIARYGPTTIEFIITNAGPSTATAVTFELTPDFEVETEPFMPISFSMGNHVSPGSTSFGPFTLGPGESNTQKLTNVGVFDSVTMTAVASPDVPNGPPNNPDNNKDVTGITVIKGDCDRKAGGDADLKNKAPAETVCTKGGDDKVKAGNGDVVYTSGGDDLGVCVNDQFCAFELGGGDDVAKCPDACFVDGGSGKDNCPEGAGIIKQNCER